MNSADPLANLADIHIPDPVSSWPPAIGWWLVALLFLLLVIAAVVWGIRRHRRGRYRREALAQLAQLREFQQQTGQQPADTASKISGLLKQVVITQFGRHQTASLNGAAWLKFLDDKGKTSAFTEGPGRALGDDIYKPNIEIDLDSLFNLSQQWIEKQS